MDDKLVLALLEADKLSHVDDKLSQVDDKLAQALQAPALLRDDMFAQVDDMLASALLEDCKLALAWLKADKLA